MTGKRLTEEKYQGLGISEEVMNSGMREGVGEGADGMSQCNTNKLYTSEGRTGVFS